MNIAIVTTWFERGAAYVSKQIADTLIADGHTLFIYSRGGEEISGECAPWTNYSVQRDSTPRLPMPTGINKRSFKNFLAKNSIDLVIFNEQRYWAPIFWARELGIRCVAYIDYYTPKTVNLFHAYDALICNTKRHQSVFNQHKSCFYIPWGTDTTQFHPRNDGKSGDLFTFFHSAGMNPYRKGTDLLLLAAQKLSKSRSDFSILIHTQVPLEKYFPKLKSTIADLITQELLSIEHRTIPAPGLYHKGRVYVYPSRLDGIGLTIPEALACGLPVITTDSPPMSEFVTNECGVLVRVASSTQRNDGYFWPETTCDIEDLTRKMNSYCESEKYIDMQSAAARRHASINLEWRSNSRNLSSLLKEVSINEIPVELRFALSDEDSKSVRHYEFLKPLYNTLFSCAIAVRNFTK